MLFQYRWAQQHGGKSVVDVMRDIYDSDAGWRAELGPPGRTEGLGGSNIYDGAALVLYALQQKVGVHTMKRILSAWARGYADGTGSTERFIRLATRVSRDGGVDAFLRHWLFDTSTPTMPGHPSWTSTA